MEKWYNRKAFRITISVTFWITFLGLLICSILFFVFNMNNNVIADEIKQQFAKVWSGIIAVMTIINTPITFLKIKSSISLHLYNNERKKEMLLKYGKEVEMKNKEIKKHLKKSLDKNCNVLDKISMFCEIKGKKLIGVTLYDIDNIIKNSSIDDKDKRKLIVDALVKFGLKKDDSLIKFINSLF